MASTPEAKRKAKERAGKVLTGLKRIEVWAYPESHEEIKKVATKITARALKRRATTTKEQKC